MSICTKASGAEERDGVGERRMGFTVLKKDLLRCTEASKSPRPGRRHPGEALPRPFCPANPGPTPLSPLNEWALRGPDAGWGGWVPPMRRNRPLGDH